MPRKTVLFAIWGFIMMVCRVSAQDLTLPVYHLTIDPVLLEQLLQNPYQDTPRPAILTCDSIDYACEVRFRGATGRDLPKKSWKVHFDGDGPLGRDETNLNAEYRDRLIIRNALCMELTRQLGQPAPESRFVSLMVNGEYWGVHHEIESVDGDFFERRSLDMQSLVKALSHACRFSPILQPERFHEYYEPKEAPRGSIDTLLSRFVFFSHATRQEIADHAAEMMDVENILCYFAAQYAVCNNDGYTKNNYIVGDRNDIYSLIPWDCDATLGNDWQGDFVIDPEDNNMGLLAVQALFQRLVAVDEYSERFSELLESALTTGFDSLAVLAQRYYDQIRHDVYLDTMKRGTNEEFDDALSDLFSFFSLRTSAMSGLPQITRYETEDYRATVDYIDTAGMPVFVSVYIEDDPLEVMTVLWDANNEDYWMSLHDNGVNGDQVAGDHYYSREFNYTEAIPPLYYNFRIKPPNEIGGSYWPPGGDFNFRSYPLHLPVIGLSEFRPLPENCEIETVVQTQSGETHGVILRNTGDHELRLDGHVVRIGRTTRLGQIGRPPPLPPGQAFVFTNHPHEMFPHYPNRIIAEGLYFPAQAQDTVYLETPSGDIIFSEVIEEVEILENIVGTVVINEINYNSADDFEAGDWIELHAPAGEVLIGEWVLRDDNDDHTYVIPQGTTIPSGGYIVIADEPEDFVERFPSVNHVLGPIDFGFSGSGDDVRLFDRDGMLVDEVSYNDAFPWPPEPDGDGPTLELTNPYLDNNSAENWRASLSSAPHGTPGAENSVFVSDIENPSPIVAEDFRIVNAFPNPFNSEVRIEFIAPRIAGISIRIYDILGRVTKSIQLQGTPGLQSAVWNGFTTDGTMASSGIYFVYIGDENSHAMRKVVLLR